jgi:hypothetical protein
MEPRPAVDLRSAISGLAQLQADTLGDDAVCVAVLDGPVDLSHPCFVGADLRTVDTLVRDAAGSGAMSLHGTHVTSLLFGQPGTPVSGIAPRCRGLILPIFHDERQRLSQLDLARAIEAAVREGAHIVSVSGGERSPNGEADEILANALRLCEANNVLVVAAVGNDGCACLQVPAACPSVLAVGAATAEGEPLESSNWGDAYRANGVLATGHEIEGARPGGGTATISGTSFATPIVAGIAALLLAVQRRNGHELDPHAVRAAILNTASSCQPRDGPSCRRHLSGVLNVPAAYEVVKQGEAAMPSTDVTPVNPLSDSAGSSHPDTRMAGGTDEGVVAACECSAARNGTASAAGGFTSKLVDAQGGHAVHRESPSVDEPLTRSGVTPASNCACEMSSSDYIYAIGSIGFDFGTEARRDSFIQQMEAVELSGHVVPANPYDPHQLNKYLSENPWSSDKLIWTCKLESTPIYALEAEIPFGMTWGGLPITKNGKLNGFEQAYPPVSVVHKTFRDAILGQALNSNDTNFVSRVSVPGTLTKRTVRLFSGQCVPVVVVHAQGLYTWNESVLVNSLLDQIRQDIDARGATPQSDEMVKRIIRAFLDKVYYEFRNLGQSSPDRALNYAATNAFELARELVNGFLSGRLVPRRPDEPEPLYALDDITVTKSPYCRMDSDCWDVRITFFDPENDRHSRVTYLLTIDVSSNPPVSLAPTHKFLVR